MGLSIIENDKDELNASRIPDRLQMSSNPRVVRPVKNVRAEVLGTDVRTPDTIPNKLGSSRNREQNSVAYLPSETTNDHRRERSQGRASTPTYEFIKRTFDLILGVVLLLIATPIILIAAVAIRIESKGSPFFVQTRLGKNGHPFKIFKLRGMYIDAKARFPSYYDYSKNQDLEFCFHHEADPRVTRAGNFIRRTSIDELPNLWNVVLGDMSLVGPRPEIPEVIALYGPYRSEYLSVQPGVTCLSKCTGRDKLTKRETIEYDIGYIRHRGFVLDMKILWRTFRGVMLRHDVF